MDDATKCRLLQLARRVVEAEVRKSPLPPPGEGWPALGHSGAFVTLRIGGRLRGCIGTFQPGESLPWTIREVAIQACHDSRFLACPLACRELPHLRIEISVLSALERTSQPCTLQVGVHGIHIRRGDRTGCFLPQVATEMGWDAEMFLSRCCRDKAGLPSHAWQDRDTEVSLFTTECFGE